tara:strand:- start:434 stop:859 length:426 start_codon:yes stop_codon:yes gene_type:complete
MREVAAGKAATVVVRMAGDGNCLFRALAHPHGDHRVVRACVVRHMRERWHADYAPFVDARERGTYLDAMAEDGTWGDELVLRAFARLARVPVRVHAAEPPHPLLSAYGEDGRAPSARRRAAAAAARALTYDGAHYDVLLTV